jgi:hypothetical protein
LFLGILIKKVVGTEKFVHGDMKKMVLQIILERNFGKIMLAKKKNIIPSTSLIQYDAVQMRKIRNLLQKSKKSVQR